MGTVVEFPCRARVAANDANPWLSAELLRDPAKPAPRAEPIYAQACRVYDQASGITYTGYALPDEKKLGCRVWLFVLAVIGWLLLFSLV